MLAFYLLILELRTKARGRNQNEQGRGAEIHRYICLMPELDNPHALCSQAP